VAETLFEQLGGEPKLRAVIDDFVDRVFDDMMIGFFFVKADKDQIKRFEFQHASELLGGPAVYAGRPLRQAHAAHPIRGGHFARRMQILRQVLAAHGVPEAVQQHWIEHDMALARQITNDGVGECND
jgi:hemoglobin